MKIEPCPFCGNKNLEIGNGTEDREGHPIYIICGDCGCSGPWVYAFEIIRDLETVVELTNWNTRWNTKK